MSDLISRKAAIDALRGYLVGKRCPDDGTLTCRLIENEVINKLPPIQPDNNSEVPNSSDCISRRAAIGVLRNRWMKTINYEGIGEDIAEECEIYLKTLPSAQPEIIYCKDCRKHNKKIGFDENYHTVWKEDACPLVSWRGKAQGHEFDYQYCVYAERREVTT